MMCIVYCSCPRDPDQKLIKRVIAVEGETIKTSSRGHKYVSIPSGHCWVEGDHMSHSMDSNFFGPVALGLIFAKASHIVWPPSRWQRLDSSAPIGRHPVSWPRPDLAALSWGFEEDD
ncbi:hypothetical protein JTE90_017834 [Oedothorax gibbosus]|uniref:Mitochondrial inner membrane protease subunit 2 n=1 Tax=Oedothorax gibbosus TaxID=931172 RepID=A0AAV6VBN9_9ARAC|nr:hypothetical protein JTE90_017834 [Oedothorax gibbosus]